MRGAPACSTQTTPAKHCALRTQWPRAASLLHLAFQGAWRSGCCRVELGSFGVDHVAGAACHCVGAGLQQQAVTFLSRQSTCCAATTAPTLVKLSGTLPVLFLSNGGPYSVCSSVLHGPWFGASIFVSGAFDATCWTSAGASQQYVNSTGVRAHEVMTGQCRFQPRIVEVYWF
jgi:hypothetical protein